MERRVRRLAWVGVALCLVGLMSWPRRGLLSGLAFGLASMARAEAWIFGFGTSEFASKLLPRIEQKWPNGVPRPRYLVPEGTRLPELRGTSSARVLQLGRSRGRWTRREYGD